MIRPSYVLGGRAMEIVHDGAEIDRYVTQLSATLDSPPSSLSRTSARC